MADSDLVPHRPPQTLTRKLSADDDALHPLMRHTLRAYIERRNPSKRLMRGAMIPLQSVRLLIRHPKLWPWALAPSLINIALFGLLLYFTLPAASHSFSSLWASPIITAWYHYALTALWWLCYLLVMLLTGVIAYMSSMVLGGVLASPFNDELSTRTEKILLGARYEALPSEPFFPALVRSMLSSAAMAGLYVGVMAPLLLLHLVPVVGSIAYTLIAGVAGGYFVALEYTDTLLERRNTTFRHKLEHIWRERSLTMGFGVGMSLLLAVPLLNFFCIPIAVIGGTATGMALLDAEPGAHSEPQEAADEAEESALPPSEAQ